MFPNVSLFSLARRADRLVSVITKGISSGLSKLIYNRRPEVFRHSLSFNMDYVVDLQGFHRSTGQFILKKFSMIPIYGKVSELSEFIVKPPFPFENLLKEYQTINLWTARNVHGISWDTGTVPYELAKTTIRNWLRKARTVYVRGSEKKNWLLSFLGTSVKIVDLRKLSCPTVIQLKDLVIDPSLETRCPREYQYADENVRLLRLWILHNNVVPKPKRFFQDVLPTWIFAMSKKSGYNNSLIIEDTVLFYEELKRKKSRQE